jgi:uncharacterized cysteine cluster protein YcgN (CxxCxxCC family)
MAVDFDGSDEVPFWRRKSLADMTEAEWESLCDGCGRCCLIKLDAGSERSLFTDVGCRLLDENSCRCRDYENRLDLVKSRFKLTPENIKSISHWQPPSCAYVLLAEGKDSLLVAPARFRRPPNGACRRRIGARQAAGEQP